MSSKALANVGSIISCDSIYTI